MKKLALVALGVAFGSLAFGQNLLTNPGFETGDYTGWTIDSQSIYMAVNTVDPHSGSYALQIGATTADGDQIHQTVADTSGANYVVSFWAVNVDAGSGEDAVHVSYDGNTLYNADPGGAYAQFSFNVVGTGSDTVTIAGWNSPSYSYVDDVSMAAPVPEPASMAALGIGVLALIRRKRRS